MLIFFYNLIFLLKILRPVKKKNTVKPEEAFVYPHNNSKAFQADDTLFPLSNQKVLLFNANDDKDEEERLRREEIEREKELIIKQENEKVERYLQAQQEKLENMAKKIRKEKEDSEYSINSSKENSKSFGVEDFQNIPPSDPPSTSFETNIIEDRWEAILTIPRFRTVWGSLQPSGSFTTKLLSLPDFKQLSNHLASIPGLHLVYSISNFNESTASTSLNDKNLMNFNMNTTNLPEGKLMEFAICNTRPVGDVRWFLARFSVDLKQEENKEIGVSGVTEDQKIVRKTAPVFSAAMKASTPDIVSQYVKNFNLAKVLKIDTRR